MVDRTASRRLEYMTPSRANIPADFVVGSNAIVARAGSWLVGTVDASTRAQRAHFNDYPRDTGYGTRHGGRRP